MQHDYDKNHGSICVSTSQQVIQWKRYGVLKFDEMKIKDKVIYNPHTNEIIGFEDGACNKDVMTTKLANIIGGDTDKDESDDSRDKPSIAKHILISMFIR